MAPIIKSVPAAELVNPSQQNNVFQFVQTTKPTERSAGVALVAGDRWYKTDDQTEWSWNGTYWLSPEQVAVIEANPLNISTSDRYRFQGGYTTKGGTHSVFLKSIHAHLIFASAQSPGGAIDSSTNYWNIQYQVVEITNSAFNIVGATYSSQGVYNGANYGPFINLNVNAIVLKKEVPRFGFYHAKIGSPSNISIFPTTFVYCFAL
jgi:hypothetical protein